MLRLTALALLAASLACSESPRSSEAVSVSGAALVERTHTTMGSELHLTAWIAERAAAEAAFEEVFREFDRLDAVMSVWREGSEVLRLNAAAGERPVRIGADVRETLMVAREVSLWTDGKFDVTFGALSGLWRFDHDQDNRIPDAAAVRARLPLIDYRQLEVNDEAGTAFLQKKGMSVHLGGIGKGYAVDRGAEILRRRGVRDFLIQAGGDLYAGGRRGDRPWRVGIRDPRGPADRSFAALDVTDQTVSTSGDYERAFLSGGRRYHHIIDPDLGEPSRDTRSVTIVARRAILADALSTGVFLLGSSRGLALIEKLPDVEGVIVTARNEVLVSSGLQNRLIRLAPPTDAP
jgi:thiamine biosynthesis lipoprotein